MRALDTAATGMKSQQLFMDTVSNNLANVNTTGYKMQRVEFKDLLYQQLQPSNFSAGVGKPVNLEVGHGVALNAIVRDFGKGNLQQTNNNLDTAIDGEGFYAVRDAQNNMFYTKDGGFKLSVEGTSSKLVNSEGDYLQGNGGDITLGEDVKEITIDKTGLVSVKRGSSTTNEDIDTLRLVRFANPAGLESVGSNLLKATAASGDPTENTDGTNGSVLQGYLETSNVQVVDEMIKLITAQRAYEINSKAIQTADSMLEMADNLKR